MRRIWRYLRLWIKLTENSFLTAFVSRLGAGLFLVGKSLRFILFGVFLFSLFVQVRLLADYTFLQVIFFYLTFNFLDTVVQLFFREVYRFRELVVRGDFDLVLTRPANPLFRALVGGADPLDLFMLVPYVGLLVWVGGKIGELSSVAVLGYLILLVNGFLIAAGFHILILGLGILTTEIDHAVMIYRDISSMGRVPIDIYREPLRGFLTFVVPVGIMVTFPVKAILGLLSPQAVLYSCIFGIIFLALCINFWKYALTKYASASS